MASELPEHSDDDLVPSSEFQWAAESPTAAYIDRSQRLSPPVELPNTTGDPRLYVPRHLGWEAEIKRDWVKEHCYAKFPDEDWFHPLAAGELYIQRGDEKYCLNCALRLRIITHNRLWWQKGSSTIGDQVEPLEP